MAIITLGYHYDYLLARVVKAMLKVRLNLAAFINNYNVIVTAGWAIYPLDYDDQ